MSRRRPELSMPENGSILVPPHYLRLPKFDPTPKALKIIPLYEITAEEEEKLYGPGRGRSHSSRHPPRGARAVYTDSEYEDSRPFVPSMASSANGRGRAHSGRGSPYYNDDEDSYQEDSPSRADSRYEESRASRHRYYPDPDPYSSYERPEQHHQASGSQYGESYGQESPPRKLQKPRPESSLHPARSQSTLQAHKRRASDASERPDVRHFIADVRQYLKVLPMHPDFRYSKCNGRKKAVCIGINYVGQKDQLKGCANDARNMRKFIMAHYGFQSQDILLIVDDGDTNSSIRPTRKEMFNAMSWLVKDAQKHDSLFFHYSGHGGQTPDPTGKEADGMDEVIFPVDYSTANDIVDNELHQALVSPLPPGCRLTAIFDSCHSGTVLDLPYLHSAHGRLRGLTHISRRMQERGMAPSADVISFAACKDDETSADTFSGGVATGAMSHEFVRSLEQNPNQTYEELLQDLRDTLIPKYHQKAQISGTHPLDIERRFIL